jgi:hypothetical protein
MAHGADSTPKKSDRGGSGIAPGLDHGPARAKIHQDDLIQN